MSSIAAVVITLELHRRWSSIAEALAIYTSSSPAFDHDGGLTMQRAGDDIGVLGDGDGFIHPPMLVYTQRHHDLTPPRRPHRILSTLEGIRMHARGRHA